MAAAPKSCSFSIAFDELAVSLSTAARCAYDDHSACSLLALWPHVARLYVAVEAMHIVWCGESTAGHLRCLFFSLELLLCCPMLLMQSPTHAAAANRTIACCAVDYLAVRTVIRGTRLIVRDALV